MKAKLITYTAKGRTIAEQNQLRMKLNGQTSTSHKGKYIFHRRGILEDISHIKPNRGSIIVPIKDSQKIIQLLKKYKAKIKTFDISIEKSTFKKAS